MSPRKVLVGILIVLFLLIVATYIGQEIRQREALRNMKVYLESVEIKSFGLTSATLRVRLRLYNPGEITATLDRAEFDLYGNNIYLGHGIISHRVDIPPGNSRIISTDFDVSYSGALSLLCSALSKGRVRWRIIGTAYIDIPFGSISIPFDVSS